MKFCPQCAEELVVAEIDGRPHQSCRSETCDYVFWDNLTPVVAAIVELDGEVVLVRNKTWQEKIFGLVAGFLGGGEIPDDAILREVRQNCDLTMH